MLRLEEFLSPDEMLQKVCHHYQTADSTNNFMKITFLVPFLKQRAVNFKMSFCCLQIDQKTNEIFLRISSLASKKK
jgi:hypothetical protein